MLVLEGHSGPIAALAFSPDGEKLASSGPDGEVRLWAPPSELNQWRLHSEVVNALAFSANGQYLASGSSDRMLHVLDVRDGRTIASTGPMQHAISVIGFVGEGSIVFGIGERPGPVARPSTMFLLDLATKKQRRLSFDVVHGIRAIATIPERKLMAWATDTKVLRVQDISRPPGRPVTLKKDCRALAMSGDGRRLAVASDWEILLFDLEPWPSSPVVLGRHRGTVSSLVFSPDSRMLLSGSWDGTVRVWDLERNTEQASFTWPVGNRVTAISVASDGLRAAAAGDSGSIVVWDLD